MVPAPSIIIYLLGFFLDSFSWFPISRDQLKMLMEGNTCNSQKTYTIFKFKPKKFSKENLLYLNKKN